MIIKAYQCKVCEDILFSRAKHDYRTCSCGKISVNGGIEYLRVTSTNQFPNKIELDLEITERELFVDWNSRKDEFGWIRSGKKLQPAINFSRKLSDL